MAVRSALTMAGPSERAGFMEAPLDRSADERSERDGAADGEGCRVLHRAGVGGDRGDDEHEEEGEERLQASDWSSPPDGWVRPRSAPSPSEMRSTSAPSVAPVTWATP